MITCRWFAVLGVTTPTDDGRHLDRDGDWTWSVRQPLLHRVLGAALFEPIGVVIHVGIYGERILALGSVTAPESVVSMMADRTLRPEMDFDELVSFGRLDPMRFIGGRLRAVTLGTAPAFPGAHFELAPYTPEEK